MAEIKVGEIFYASWGYEQTNIDFLQVVGFTKSGKSAICRMMGQELMPCEGLHPMAEYVKPKGVFGEPFKLRLRSSECMKDTILVGTYPFCDRGTRPGHFYRWDGKQLYQSHYA